MVEAEAAGHSQAVCLVVAEAEREAEEASLGTKGVVVVAEAKARQANHSLKVPNS